MDTIVKLINTRTFDEYEFSIPMSDVGEYFVTVGAYSDYIAGNYVLESLKGDFEFLEYDELTDINRLNHLISKYESLRPQEKEKILLLTSLYGDSVDAFFYAMDSYPIYTLVPKGIVTKKDVIHFVINELYETPSLVSLFGETIDHNLFYRSLFARDIAVMIDKRILIKHLELGI